MRWMGKKLRHWKSASLLPKLSVTKHDYSSRGMAWHIATYLSLTCIPDSCVSDGAGPCI